MNVKFTIKINFMSVDYPATPQKIGLGVRTCFLTKTKLTH